MKRALRSRSIWITFILLIALAANAAWQQYAGAAKLTASGIAPPNALENVIVDLNVPPEQFHMTRLQMLGTMVGAQGHSVSLRGVTPDHLKTIATRSWVAAVRRMND